MHYTIVFHSDAPEPDATRRLRALLKFAGRQLGFKALSVRVSVPEHDAGDLVAGQFQPPGDRPESQPAAP